MGIVQTLEKYLIKFGANNSPTFVAMSIATAKGIFRPAFTMSDKHENYETKRYTAIRAGLTDLIAIPIYYTSGLISRSIAKKISVPKNFMSRKIYTRYKAGERSDEIINAVKHAEELAKINLPKAMSTAAFAGVCISALFLIPFICSATIKPIMNQIEKKGTGKNKNTDNPVKKSEHPYKNTYKAPYANLNTGMKVGGL